MKRRTHHEDTKITQRNTKKKFDRINRIHGMKFRFDHLVNPVDPVKNSSLFSVFLCVTFVSLWWVLPLKADPLSPKDELATFKTLPGFKVELVASEPDVIDPVSMAFDERADCSSAR